MGLWGVDQNQMAASLHTHGTPTPSSLSQRNPLKGRPGGSLGAGEGGHSQEASLEAPAPHHHLSPSPSPRPGAHQTHQPVPMLSTHCGSSMFLRLMFPRLKHLPFVSEKMTRGEDPAPECIRAPRIFFLQWTHKRSDSHVLSDSRAAWAGCVRLTEDAGDRGTAGSPRPVLLPHSPAPAAPDLSPALKEGCRTKHTLSLYSENVWVQ